MYKKQMKKYVLLAVVLLFFCFSASALAANVGDYADFNVDQNYDIDARQKLQATLVKVSPSLYFYVEKKYWDSLNQATKNEVLNALENVSYEFDNNIYPRLTSLFGKEWRPGIDKDNRITVLFHGIKGAGTGYFRSSDQYEKLQIPNSNEREMVYLSIAQITSLKLKEFLAHEFVHLITFNQKDRIYGVQEEIWLNEARADYASTILGYDTIYEGSNLQRRARDFLEKPDDPMTEWANTKYDYAAVNLFTHYLVDQYGIDILKDSLKLDSVGIESINKALLLAGAKEDFAKIFTNWTIAIVVNNCAISIKYCYLNPHLGNIRISPSLLFLPLTGSSSLSVTNFTKNWTGNWQKIIGGSGNLKLEFSSFKNLNFHVPYIVTDKNNTQAVNFLPLDANKIGEINIENFSNQYNSLVIIPSLQNRSLGPNDDLEPVHPYSITLSNKQDNPSLEQKLLAQIDLLKKQIAALQGQNNEGTQVGCSQINGNLFRGTSGDSVKCLQQFLKIQGTDIYPEGLVTGNFGSLTKAAVIRFQEKHSGEILAPVGLSRGTGFVGSLTRQKINQLLLP